MNKTADPSASRRQRCEKALLNVRRHPLSALLLLAGLLLLAWAVYVISGQAYAELHYRAALRELEQSTSAQTQEHLTQAEAHLALCLKARPNSLEANFLAARTARRLLNSRDAVDYLNRYKKLEGVPEAWKLEEALLQVQQGDLDYAGYLWSCAQKDHPDKLLILEALARAFMRTYQYRSAQACLEQWLDVQPRSLQALLWLGQLHRTLSEYAQAIALYGRAVALDPESDEARLNLAEILIYTHKAPEALRQFEILAERQPGNVAVVLGQARCKAELSETEEARKLFDRLVGVKPDDATILAESGKLLLNAGQVVEAETRLRAALRLAPNEREALYSMYKCLEQQGKKEEAHKYLDQCNRVERDLDRCKALASKIMQGDSNPAPRCELARILMRNGLWDEARRWLDDAIRVDSKHQEIYLLFADYYEHAGQSAVAARCRALAAELAAPAR